MTEVQEATKGHSPHFQEVVEDGPYEAVELVHGEDPAMALKYSSTDRTRRKMAETVVPRAFARPVQKGVVVSLP